MKPPVHIGKSHLWLILVITTLGIAFVGYRQYDSWQTEQKFANLEQDIDALKTELEKQGISDIAKNKYCIRDGEKFGGGQLRCQIEISAETNPDTLQNQEIEKVLKQINTSGKFSEIVKFNQDSPSSSGQYSYDENIDCYLTNFQTSNVNNSQNPYFTFYCIDAVNKPVYPIIE